MTCTAHQLQLVVRGALTKSTRLRELNAAIQKIASRFSRRGQMCERLIQAQQQLTPDKSPLAVLHMASTRWGSSYLVAKVRLIYHFLIIYLSEQRLADIWPAVNVVFEQHGLSTGDLSHAQVLQFAALLKPIYDATIEVQRLAQPTLCTVYLIVEGLLTTYQTSEQWPLLVNAAREMSKLVSTRFDFVRDVTSSRFDSTYIIGSALVPLHHAYIDADMLMHAKSCLQAQVRQPKGYCT